MAKAKRPRRPSAASGERRPSSQDVYKLATQRLKQQPDFDAHVAAIGAGLAVAEYKFARRVTGQLTQRWPERVDSWLIATRAWESCGDLERGIARLRKQIERSKRTDALQVRLAEMLERTHRLDEAHEILTQQFSDPMSDGRAAFVTAKIRRRQGDLDSAIDLLRQLSAEDYDNESLSWEAGYELARCLDTAGRFREAYYSLAVTKQRQGVAAARWITPANQLLQQHQQLAGKLTAAHLELGAKRSASRESKVSHDLIFLGGFPRSGTTLVESALARHSRLRTLEETPVFSQSILNPINEKLAAAGGPIEMLETVSDGECAGLRSIYLRRGSEYFDEAIGEHRWIDKNPVLTPAVPFLIRIFPNTKVVVCCRDPRDVLLSNCFLTIGQINSFNAHYFKSISLARWIKTHWDCLQRLRDVAPGLVHIVAYESAVTNFESTMEDVLSFLELIEEPAVVRHAPGSGDRSVRSPTYAQVAQPLYQSAIGRWRNYAEELRPALEVLEPVVSDWQAIHRSSN